MVGVVMGQLNLIQVKETEEQTRSGAPNEVGQNFCGQREIQCTTMKLDMDNNALNFP